MQIAAKGTHCAFANRDRQCIRSAVWSRPDDAWTHPRAGAIGAGRVGLQAAARRLRTAASTANAPRPSSTALPGSGTGTTLEPAPVSET